MFKLLLKFTVREDKYIVRFGLVFGV